MFRVAVAILCCWSLPILGPSAATAEPEPSQTYRPGPPIQYRVGVVVEADSACRNVVALLAVPRDWPEQTVRELSRESVPKTARITFDDQLPGARLMKVRIPRLDAGQQARAILVYEVTTAAIDKPPQTEAFRRPTRLEPQLRRYLGQSPQIETKHPQITRLAKSFRADAQADDWSLVEAIYDDVRQRIAYRFDEQPRGALHALTTSVGDCEELTSLFIALCRNHNIPARSVWVDGHTYPEFYLVDAKRQGHWFPCQAAGDRAFGELPSMRPILQKGDRFQIPGPFRRPGQPTEARYVGEHVRATPAAAGATPPRVRFVREIVAPATDIDVSAVPHPST